MKKILIIFLIGLSNCGIAVAEEHRDAVKWTGRASYQYTHNNMRDDTSDSIRSNFSLRLEPHAVINKNWSAHARLDTSVNMRQDTTGKVSLRRIWAEGKFGDTVLRVGKVPLTTNENGIVLSGTFSGMTVKTGKKWEALFLAGRLNVSKTGVYQAGRGYANVLKAMGLTQEESTVRSMASDPADIWGANLQYKTKQGFYGGLGYYHLKSQAYNVIDDAAEGDGNVEIASVNVGYQFSPKLVLKGAYAKAYYERHSDKSIGMGTVQDYSWEVELSYGDYNRAQKKGMWEAYLAYSNYGYVSSVMPISSTIGEMFDDDMGIANWGEHGWEVGGAWAPEKNIGIVASYFWGKSITTNQRMESVLTRLEMFF